MKVLKSLITLVVLLVAATKINAQQIDSRCYEKYCGGFKGTPNNVTIDISKAKSEAGDNHEKFTVIARPKAQDRPVVAISQEGTWWKGIYADPRVYNKNLTCLACARDEFKYGSASLDMIQNGYYGLIIAEAEYLGEYTLVSEIDNYKDLDPAYDWTFLWNE